MKDLNHKQITAIVVGAAILGYLFGTTALPRPEFVGCTAEKHQHLLATVTAIYRLLAGATALAVVVGLGFLSARIARNVRKSKFWERSKLDRESRQTFASLQKQNKQMKKLAERKAKIVPVGFRHRFKFKTVQLFTSLTVWAFSENGALVCCGIFSFGYLAFSKTVFADLCITTFVGWAEFVLPAIVIGLALLLGLARLLTEIPALAIRSRASERLLRMTDPTKNSVPVLQRAKFLQALQEEIGRNKHVCVSYGFSLKKGSNEFIIDNNRATVTFDLDRHNDMFIRIDILAISVARINRYHVPASTPVHAIHATLLRDVSGLIDDLHNRTQEARA